jgi:magnesium transporter
MVMMLLFTVCTLFGTNVQVPWQNVNNVHAFLGIASGMILVAAVVLLVARRTRYI